MTLCVSRHQQQAETRKKNEPLRARDRYVKEGSLSKRPPDAHVTHPLVLVVTKINKQAETADESIQGGTHADPCQQGQVKRQRAPPKRKGRHSQTKKHEAANAVNAAKSHRLRIRPLGDRSLVPKS